MGTSKEKGLEAVKAGNLELGRRLLRIATHENPNDIETWLEYAKILVLDEQKLEAYQKALQIDPSNEEATAGLSGLLASRVNAGGAEIAPKPRGKIADGVIFRTKPSILPTFVMLGLAILLNLGVTLICVGPITLIGFKFDDWAYVGVGAFFILMLIIPGGLLGFRVYSLRSKVYTLTSEQLTVTINGRVDTQLSVPTKNLRKVLFKQSLIKRFFSIGDIIVETMRKNEPIELLDIEEGGKHAKEIMDIIRKNAEEIISPLPSESL